MKETPLISVIVPIYKVEQYLKRCIDSIINQTYHNLEIILVDDGSPDNCPKICDDYASQDNRIKVIHKQNGGLADARNVGIKESTGTYITFVDSDDFVSLSYVEILHNGIISHNADIAIAKFKRFEKEDETLTVNISDDWNFFSEIEVFKKYSSLNTAEAMPFISVCNKLYKRTLFKDIEFPKDFLYEDAYTSYKLLDKAQIITVSSNQLYFYFINPTSIMGQAFQPKHYEMVKAFQETVHYFDKKNKNEIALMFYAPLLMREIYCWWGFSSMLKNKEESEKILRQYKNHCKMLKKIKTLPYVWKFIFKTFALFPSLYALYRKYSPVHVGNR